MNQFCHKLLIVIAVLYSFTSAANAESVWTLVTNVSELAIGDTVIIVASDADYAMSTEQKTNNRGQIAIKKEGIFCSAETASNSTYDIQKLTLSKGKKDNTYAFYTGDGYLFAASSGDNNWLRTETTLSNNSSWEITITKEKTKIIAQGTNTNNELRYNNKSALFSCYYKSSTQPEVVLYKLTDPNSIKDCTITLSVDGIEETEALRAGSSFTLPTDVPEVAGLDFVGWSTTSFPIGSTETPTIKSPGETVCITNDTVFYALYGKKEEIKEPAYVKIESEQGDWSGIYLLVCESENISLDGSLESEKIGKEKNYDTIKIYNKQIQSNKRTDSMSVKIAKFAEGYSIQLSHYNNNAYYIYNNGDNNFISAGANPKENTISLDKNNKTVITSNEDNEGKLIQYNKNSLANRFGYYISSATTSSIQLYKLNQTSSAYAYYTTSLNIEVTANEFGYSTWYSTIPVSIPKGLNAYYCSIEGETAVLHSINSVIPSFTGAILYSSEAASTQSSKSYILSYTDATAKGISGNHLIGFTKDTEVNNGISHYALNALNGVVGFYVPQTILKGYPTTPESPFTAKAGKAYLSINPNETPTSYAIRRIDETDINPTIETMPQCKIQIYDLFGRPVKHAGKGIYITNGKKVFF